MPTQRSGATVSVEAGRKRTGPLRVRPQSQVGSPCSSDRGGSRGASAIGVLAKANAEALVARVDRPLAAGLGILDHQQAHVGQSELARIEDFDGDDLAPASKPRKRRAPGLGRSDEVRDHDRESTPSQDASENVDGATEIDLPPES